jgi:hypothetical protein
VGTNGLSILGLLEADKVKKAKRMVEGLFLDVLVFLAASFPFLLALY